MFTQHAKERLLERFAKKLDEFSINDLMNSVHQELNKKEFIILKYDGLWTVEINVKYRQHPKHKKFGFFKGVLVVDFRDDGETRVVTMFPQKEVKFQQSSFSSPYNKNKKRKKKK